ncbi:RNA-directed DNA polymerase, eukaryota [Tanacetum coccineum]|uniref:RNA-directed DNA polymerase, eukaryota n=1 Tax=Tanacetum coccineum TaxID=301880 RepID=A0ABQ5DLV4_9ASTR
MSALKSSFANVVKGTGVQEICNAPVMVLERGTLNYKGDPMLVGGVKDFKSLPNIHNICSTEGIDVEGTPLRSWSHATLNKIAGKWGELVYLDISNVPNKYSMRLCVKTRFQHLIVESFKVSLDGKVYVVRAKEVTGWIPDFREEKYNQSEDGNNNNLVAIHDWEKFDDEEVIPDSFQSHVNVATSVERHVKEAEILKTTSKQENVPFEDPFGLEGIIYKSSKKNATANTLVSERVTLDQCLVQDKGEANNNLGDVCINDSDLKDKSSCSSSHDHADSMAQTTKLINGVSILEWLGGKEKKQRVKSLCHSYRVNFLSLQETKMVSFDVFVVRAFWGNMLFDFATSLARGRSGGTWLATNSDLLFMSVYSPQYLAHKRVLWEYIAGIINRWHGEVIVMGDFNEVRYASKRHGSSFHASNAVEFNNFIVNSHLNDVPLGGYFFTWSDKYANKMSKLDRFLVSNGILDLFSNLSGLILHRHISDHRPILLKEYHVDYGPTPFRLFHSLFLEQDFTSIIENSGNNDEISAPNAMTLLKNKLKSLKLRLKTWSTEKKSIKDHDRKLLHDSLIEIDPRIDKGASLPDDMSNRAKKIHDLQVLDKNTSVDLAQKAKVKWAIEGDENTKFYHGIMNKKIRHLSIKGVLVDGEWIDTLSRVKTEFYSHFTNRFSAPNWVCVSFDAHFPRRLDNDQSYDLESDVTNGLDSFTLEFFKKFCLIGCQYKIIGKILANRLSLVIDDIINPEQSAFIKGRQIMDGPLILNEVISWCKSKKVQSLLFKVDFQKAFDSVRWDHIDDILDKLCFGNKWRGGLRQGDPLSPFLFILVMESLHVSFQQLIDKGAILTYYMSLFKVPKGGLSHLESLRNSFFLGADMEERKIT